MGVGTEKEEKQRTRSRPARKSVRPAAVRLPAYNGRCASRWLPGGSRTPGRASEMGNRHGMARTAEHVNRWRGVGWGRVVTWNGQASPVTAWHSPVRYREDSNGNGRRHAV